MQFRVRLLELWIDDCIIVNSFLIHSKAVIVPSDGITFVCLVGCGSWQKQLLVDTLNQLVDVGGCKIRNKLIRIRAITTLIAILVLYKGLKRWIAIIIRVIWLSLILCLYMLHRKLKWGALLHACRLQRNGRQISALRCDHWILLSLQWRLHLLLPPVLQFPITSIIPCTLPTVHAIILINTHIILIF